MKTKQEQEAAAQRNAAYDNLTLAKNAVNAAKNADATYRAVAAGHVNS